MRFMWTFCATEGQVKIMGVLSQNRSGSDGSWDGDPEHRYLRKGKVFPFFLIIH